jgi:hypothetical protein
MADPRANRLRRNNRLQKRDSIPLQLNCSKKGKRVGQNAQSVPATMKRELTPEPLPQINAEKGCLHVLSTFLGSTQ